MKNIFEVLLLKQAEIENVRREVQALRIAADLLGEEADKEEFKKSQQGKQWP